MRNQWTVQFIPHGKGDVKSVKIHKPTVLILIGFFFVALLASILFSYYSWNSNKAIKEKINLYLQENQNYLLENQQYKQQNEALKANFDQLYSDLNRLKQEVEVNQTQLEELQQLEEEVNEVKTSGLFDIQEETLKKSTVRVASIEETTSQDQPMIQYMEQIRSNLDALESDVLVQESNLNELRQELEERQYEAQFIPSISPAKGRITSSYGIRRDPFTKARKMHEGLDIAGTYKTPIYATAKGKVTFAGRNGAYGKQVAINHGNGYVTTYSHLTAYDVRKGDSVEKGDIIGRMGSTGRSTGVHVHYEILKNGNPINPASYIEGGTVHVGEETSND